MAILNDILEGVDSVSELPKVFRVVFGNFLVNFSFLCLVLTIALAYRMMCLCSGVMLRCLKCLAQFIRLQVLIDPLLILIRIQLSSIAYRV